jgi:riboflavin synthase alpha subunit
MFTGLVEELGKVVEARRSGSAPRNASLRLAVKAPGVAKGAAIGDSIALR